MSGQNLSNNPQPHDLRMMPFRRPSIKTFGYGENQKITRIDEFDQFKSNSITLPIQLKPGNSLVNQELTFSSPLPTTRWKLHTSEIKDSDSNSKMQTSQVSDWIKERQALREMMDESSEAMTKKFLANKECNPLEKHYLATGEQKLQSSPICKDPSSRILMFYQYLLFNFGKKRVDRIKKFFSTHNEALSVRFNILDTQNRGFIPTEDAQNICLQFAKPNIKDSIIEMLDFIEENGSVCYKSILINPNNISEMVLYGNGSKTRTGSIGKIENLSPIITSDQVILRKREEFEKLVKVCEENNIILSKHSLEKALLLPETKTMDDIINHFTGISLEPPNPQPGLLYRNGNSSDSEEDVEEPKSIQMYLPKRTLSSKRVHLSTGYVRNKAKIDCWLTFDDYLSLVRRNKKTVYFPDPLPSTCKRYLADNNAFWPGSYLDKQFPHLPNTPKSLKPHRVHFQQVDRRFNRAGVVSKHGVNVWPTNEAGYVQYGSIPDKQCAL